MSLNVDANPISSVKPSRKSAESTEPSAREVRHSVVRRDFAVIAVLCAAVVIFIVLCILVVVCRKRAAKKRKPKLAELEKDCEEVEEEVEVRSTNGSTNSQRNDPAEVHVEMPPVRRSERSDDDLLKSRQRSLSTLSMQQSTLLNSDIINLNSTQQSSNAASAAKKTTPRKIKAKRGTNGGNTAFSTYNSEDYEVRSTEVLKSDRTQTIQSDDDVGEKRTNSGRDDLLTSIKVSNYEPNRAPKRAILPRVAAISRSRESEDPTQNSVRQNSIEKKRRKSKEKTKKSPMKVKSPDVKSVYLVDYPKKKTPEKSPSPRKAIEKLKKNAKMDWNQEEDGVPIDQTHSVGSSISQTRSESITEEADGRPYPRVTADDIMVIRAGEQMMADEEDEDDDDLPGVPHKSNASASSTSRSQDSAVSRETDVELE